MGRSLRSKKAQRRRRHLTSNHKSQQLVTFLSRRKPSRRVSKEINDQANRHQSQFDSRLIHATELLTYTFLLPLVVEFLNDCDTLSRLLVTNRSIKQKLSRYSIKRACDPVLALSLIQCDRGLSISVPRVHATNSQLEALDALQKASNIVRQVYYSIQFHVKERTIPCYVTHLKYTVHSDFYSWHVYGEAVNLSIGTLPNTLIELDMGALYVCHLEIGSIPPSVKVLNLAWYSGRQSIKQSFCSEMIPASVTHLTVNMDAENCIEHTLVNMPSSLKRLRLHGVGSKLTSPIIPSSVTALVCHDSIIEACVIPPSVTSLKLFGGDLHPLPPSLIKLVVARFVSNWTFISPLQHLTHLSVIYCDQPISVGCIPPTVTHLRVFCHIEEDALPPSVTHLEYIGTVQKIPKGAISQFVTHLKLPSCIESDKWNGLKPGYIPSSVTHLVFGQCSNANPIVGQIPNSVTHLTFAPGFYKPLPIGFIPDSVTHLIFSDKFNQILLKQALPSNLTHLCFGRSFNKPIRSGVLPQSLTHLVFGNDFNEVLHPDDIPASVTYLAIPAGFKHDLSVDCLPKSLTYLEIPRGYVKQDNKLWLPESVTHISYQSVPVSKRAEFACYNWQIEDEEEVSYPYRSSL